MGREVRMVPAKWEHPRDRNGQHRPLFGGYSRAVAQFMEKLAAEGLQAAIEWCGVPDRADYMPDWTDGERTHLMMYETCSEGTPISPAFKTPEALARWLTDNGASAFGRCTATYEEWLACAKAGSSVCSMVVRDGEMTTGVAECTKGGRRCTRISRRW